MKAKSSKKNVLVYGAGEAGRQLVISLQNNHSVFLLFTYKNSITRHICKIISLFLIHYGQTKDGIIHDSY